MRGMRRTPRVAIPASIQVERAGIEPATSGLQILSGSDQRWSGRDGRAACNSALSVEWATMVSLI